jgi:1,4-alpha-glucan branching enzyme
MQTLKNPQSSLESTTAWPTEKTTLDFVLNMPKASSVAVAGNFNNWDASRTPLQRSDGRENPYGNQTR